MDDSDELVYFLAIISISDLPHRLIQFLLRSGRHSVWYHRWILIFFFKCNSLLSARRRAIPRRHTSVSIDWWLLRWSDADWIVLLKFMLGCVLMRKTHSHLLLAESVQISEFSSQIIRFTVSFNLHHWARDIEKIVKIVCTHSIPGKTLGEGARGAYYIESMLSVFAPWNFSHTKECSLHHHKLFDVYKLKTNIIHHLEVFIKIPSTSLSFVQISLPFHRLWKAFIAFSAEEELNTSYVSDFILISFVSWIEWKQKFSDVFHVALISPTLPSHSPFIAVRREVNGEKIRHLVVPTQNPTRSWHSRVDYKSIAGVRKTI